MQGILAIGPAKPEAPLLATPAAGRGVAMRRAKLPLEARCPDCARVLGSTLATPSDPTIAGVDPKHERGTGQEESTRGLPLGLQPYL